MTETDDLLRCNRCGQYMYFSLSGTSSTAGTLHICGDTAACANYDALYEVEEEPKKKKKSEFLEKKRNKGKPHWQRKN